MEKLTKCLERDVIFLLVVACVICVLLYRDNCESRRTLNSYVPCHHTSKMCVADLHKSNESSLNQPKKSPRATGKWRKNKRLAAGFLGKFHEDFFDCEYGLLRDALHGNVVV